MRLESEGFLDEPALGAQPLHSGGAAVNGAN
jgi:hypothetical protein